MTSDLPAYNVNIGLHFEMMQITMLHFYGKNLTLSQLKREYKMI